jgi:hypothetical protein
VNDVTRRTVAETLALVASPPLAFWLMHFVPIRQNGFLDPYFYTGHIHNFVDLFDRYGMHYSGVRFGLILPAQVTTSLFGPIAGYFVLRYLLVLVGGVPFYLLVKQRHGFVPALSVYLLWLTSPFLARTVLWDYPDASGVMFLFAAICLFSIEHSRRRLMDAAAGVCAGMAIHSNVFAIAPLAIFLATYGSLWVWWGRDVASILRRFLVVVASVAMVSALGAAYYWWRVGSADIFSVSWSMAVLLAGGGMDVWRYTGIAWVARSWWAITPALVAVLAIVAYRQRRGDFDEATVAISLAGTAAFFAISQFFLHANVLQLFYYFSYTQPLVLVSLASIVASVWRGGDRRTRAVSAAGLLIAGVGPWIVRSFGIRHLMPGLFTVHVVVVIVALTLTAAAMRFRRRGLVISASVALGLMFYSSFARGEYAGMVGNRLRPNHVELDVYRIALQFIREIPPLSQRAGVTKFWYHNGPRSLQSIQSTYLWGFSKVQGDDPTDGLPNLGTRELATLGEPGVKWLGILAEQEADVTAGRAALLENGIDTHPVSHRVLTAGGHTIHLEVFEITRRAPANLTFSTPIIDVTDRELTDVNVYGTQKGRLVTDRSAVTFVPADERDHVASPFVTIAPLIGDSWVRVRVVSTDTALKPCRLLVQDQEFNSLATLGCQPATEYAKVPAATQKIRVNLTVETLSPFVLPSRIEVALADRK